MYRLLNLVNNTKSFSRLKTNKSSPRCYSMSSHSPDLGSNSYQELVRKQDYEHYLASAFMPAHLRGGYFALRAFNIEVAAIKDSVSNKEIGKIKFAHWRESLEKAYKQEITQQPVLNFLAATTDISRLSMGFFKRVLSEREANLDSASFYSTGDLDLYCENTASSLLYLHLELLGIRDVSLDHIVSHMGKAIGITNFIRSLPFHLSRRNSVIPIEIMAKHKLSEEELYRNIGYQENANERLLDAIFEVATHAHDHILTAKAMVGKLDPKILAGAFPAFVTLIPTISYLKRLEKSQFNPMLTQRDWKLPYILWRQNRKLSLDF